MSQQRYQVIVVGGGLSGLIAADTLLARLGPAAADEGRVLVLEGADRLGGRIETHDYPDGTHLESGASYFGPTQGHMRRLIERFHPTAFAPGSGLVHHHDIADGSLSLNHLADIFGLLRVELAFHSEETYTPSTAARRIIQTMEGITRQVAALGFDGLWASNRKPWIDALDAQTWDTWIKDHCALVRLGPLGPVAAQMLVMLTRTILSAEPHQMSALFFFWYLARCGGARDITSGVADGPDSLRFAPGYGSLIEGLATAIRDRGGVIATHTRVAALERKDGLWHVDQRFTAPHIVLAVPPQAITGRIAFVPELPRDYGILHKEMARGQGRTLKGYLRYPAAWWREYTSAHASTPVYLRNELERIGEAFGHNGTLPTSVADARNEFPSGHSGYTNGTLHDVVWTMPASWRYGDEVRNPSLLWFIVGDAYDLHRKDSAADLQRHAHNTVSHILSRSKPLEPLGPPLIKDWHATQDDYGGPSAVLGPGQLTTRGAALRKAHDGLHLATTEAARIWGGYMEGAIESGIRAAHEVLGLPEYVVAPPVSHVLPTVPAWWESPSPAELAPIGLRAGFGVAPLTLIDGKPMAGYAALGKQGKNGKEVLSARALYLESKEGAVVFCVADLMSASLALTQRVSEALFASGLKLPAQLGRRDIVIAGTHTHYAPGRFYGNAFYDAFAHQFFDLKPFNGVEWEGFDTVGFDAEQVAWLVDDLTRAIRAAIASAVPAKVGIATAQAWGAASNRSLPAHARNPEADRGAWLATLAGLDGYASAKLAPEQRAVDPRATVIAAFTDDPDATLIGSLATFAAHGTALGSTQSTFSADWIGVARTRVAQRLGVDRLALGISASGDASPLEPVAVRKLEPTPGDQGPQLATKVGLAVADALVEALSRARAAATTDAPIRVHAAPWKPTIPWGVGLGITAGAEDGRNRLWRTFGPYEGNLSRRADVHHGRKFGLDFTRKVLGVLGCDVSPYHPIYLVEIGSHLVCTLPGEPTLIAGDRIARRLQATASRFASVSILSHTGDYAGYFTTPAEYEAQHYEAAHTLYGTRTFDDLADSVAALLSAPRTVARWPEVPAAAEGGHVSAAFRNAYRTFVGKLARGALWFEDLVFFTHPGRATPASIHLEHDGATSRLTEVLAIGSDVHVARLDPTTVARLEDGLRASAVLRLGRFEHDLHALSQPLTRDASADE
jgi:neutral ceramidase